MSLALFRSAPQPLHALCTTCVVTRFSPIHSLRKSRQKAKIFENFYFGPIGPKRSWNTCNCNDCVSSTKFVKFYQHCTMCSMALKVSERCAIVKIGPFITSRDRPNHWHTWYTCSMAFKACKTMGFNTGSNFILAQWFTVNQYISHSCNIPLQVHFWRSVQRNLSNNH